MPFPGCAWFFSSAPFRCYDLKCISSPILCDAVSSSSALFRCPSLLCLAFANHLSANLFLRASMLCPGRSPLVYAFPLPCFAINPTLSPCLARQYSALASLFFPIAALIKATALLICSFPLLCSALLPFASPSLCLVLLLFAYATPRPATAFRRYANPLRWVSAPRYSVASPHSVKHLRSKTLLCVAIAYPIVAPRCIAFAAHRLS